MNDTLIEPRLKQTQQRLAQLLPNYLPPFSESLLHQAMHYSCLNGGKRLRPLLVYLTGELFDCTPADLDALAVAIELIHCYSLIHDDLPAMDNDDLRRGKATCHKQFDEATAILAGDALLTLAFEIVSNPLYFPRLGAPTLLKIIHHLAFFAGAQGMVYGQAQDMAAESDWLTFEQLSQMHLAKTGALITASVQCSAIACERASDSDLENLHNFGKHIGLAFQIYDDLLDHYGDSAQMGKNTGQDLKNNKCTFVTLLGEKKAKMALNEHYDQALTHVFAFGEKANALRALATFLIERKV